MSVNATLQDNYFSLSAENSDRRTIWTTEASALIREIASILDMLDHSLGR